MYKTEIAQFLPTESRESLQDQKGDYKMRCELMFARGYTWDDHVWVLSGSCKLSTVAWQWPRFARNTHK